MLHAPTLRWLGAIGFLIALDCLAGSPQAQPGGTAKPPSPPRAAASKTGANVDVADATPEDALKTFMLALMSHDETALRAVTLPGPDFEWLLTGQPAPPEVIKDAQKQFAKMQFKRLKQGEKISLPKGKEYVVKATEVGDDRVVLLPEGSPVPSRLHKVTGHWKVAADPFIAARKAVDAARKKADAKKAASKSK